MRLISFSEYEAGVIAIGGAPFGILAIGAFPVRGEPLLAAGRHRLDVP